MAYAGIAEPTTTICVSNVPDILTVREFRLLFKFANGVERVTINHTKKGHQVGYARFSTASDAQAALDYLNGFPLDEDFPSPLKVFMSSTQLRDAPAGNKRPADGAFGMPAAKFGKGMMGGMGGMNMMGMGMMGAPMMGASMMGSPMMGAGMMGAPMMGAPMMGAMSAFGAGAGKGFGKGKAAAAASPMSVYVGGVPHEWDENTLQSLFEGFGNITKLNLTRGTNPVGNIAFVHFSTLQEAQAAISSMNNYPLDDSRHLVVRANTSGRG